MNTTTLRIVIGCLVAFVLLSLAPGIPDALAGGGKLLSGGAALLGAVATDVLLLGLAAVCCALLLVSRRQAAPRPVIRLVSPGRGARGTAGADAGPPASHLPGRCSVGARFAGHLLPVGGQFLPAPAALDRW